MVCEFLSVKVCFSLKIIFKINNAMLITCLLKIIRYRTFRIYSISVGSYADIENFKGEKLTIYLTFEC